MSTGLIDHHQFVFLIKDKEKFVQPITIYRGHKSVRFIYKTALNHCNVQADN